MLITVVIAAVLSGCTADVAPGPTRSGQPDVSLDIQDADEESITLSVGEVLVITPADDTHALRAVLLDSAVAEFTQGTDESGGTAPSIRGRAPGETEVVLSDPTGEADDVSFTLTVVR
ncbi:hypothetical protein ACIPV2_01390 [Microbacterium sp. NPDC089987]|uniref:hypothetical protein n=1 Tax=Microbacterium sp. NPDC089987 TaxID=3364202 RepID=UPI00382C1C2A